MLGEVTLRKVAAVTNAEIVHRAYLLRKDGPPKFDPQGEFLTAGWRNSIYPLAEKLGLPMQQPSRLPLTRLAHEATAWAQRQNHAEAFRRALFHAYFLEDQDISSLAVLREIAQKLWLDPDDLEKSLSENRLADEVDEDLLVGESYRITAVPAYVIGGQVLTGLQDESTLKAAIDRTKKGQPPPPNNLPQPPVRISKR